MFAERMLKAGMARLALAGPGVSVWAAYPADDLAAWKSLSLDDLAPVRVEPVGGASKHEQSVMEAPSAVSIVSADDIKKQGYRTLSDILRSVRRFYATYYDRRYNAIGVRAVNRLGDCGGRLLVMPDGQRLNDPLYDAPARDFKQASIAQEDGRTFRVKLTHRF
jgi:hypothetical protein